MTFTKENFSMNNTFASAYANCEQSCSSCENSSMANCALDIIKDIAVAMSIFVINVVVIISSLIIPKFKRQVKIL